MTFEEKLHAFIRSKGLRKQRIVRIDMSPDANKKLNKAYFELKKDVPKYLTEFLGVLVTVSKSLTGVMVIVQVSHFNSGGLSYLKSTFIREDTDLPRSVLDDLQRLDSE